MITKVGHKLDNLQPISDFDTAEMLVDILSDANEFLTYFRKLIEHLKEYIEANSKDGDNTWNKRSSETLIDGLAKFLKEYHSSLKSKLKSSTRNRYVIIKNDICSLEIIAHRVDRIVMRTNNTIGLYLADYFLDKDYQKVINMFGAISEDIEENLEGMVAICNLSKEIIEIHNQNK